MRNASCGCHHIGVVAIVMLPLLLIAHSNVCVGVPYPYTLNARRTVPALGGACTDVTTTIVLLVSVFRLCSSVIGHLALPSAPESGLRACVVCNANKIAAAASAAALFLNMIFEGHGQTLLRPPLGIWDTPVSIWDTGTRCITEC